jgi:regulator of sirC expression with transglutaminase-like and TPR domain
MDLDTALTVLAREPSAALDLGEVALLVARDEYPTLDVEAYLAELDGLANEARLRLRGPVEARVAELCRYLFHDLGFRGNRNDYYEARNSYLNDVLDRRLGLPITLSVLAMIVGNRAGLEVAGIGLPGHFVAKAIGDGREVLFDPYHGGRVLTAAQCERLVEEVVGEPFAATEEALRPTPLGLIIQRMLTNLKGVYLGNGDYRRAIRIMGRLHQLRPDDPLQRRDLGATLVQAGQPGRAIPHLEAYLEAIPNALDGAVVRRLLDQSRAAVAKWN